MSGSFYREVVSRTVDLEVVSRALERLLHQSGREVLYDCKASGHTISYKSDSAAAPTGLLPVFLCAGEAVWREATGKSLGLEIDRDPGTVLGFVVRGIHAGTFAIVMLCMIEAIEQIAQPATLLINDFAPFWQGTMDRLDYVAAAQTPV